VTRPLEDISGPTEEINFGNLLARSVELPMQIEQCKNLHTTIVLIHAPCIVYYLYYYRQTHNITEVRVYITRVSL
jgi:hypothetical protein